MPSNFKVGDHIYCGCDPMCTTSGEIESIQNDYYKSVSYTHLTLPTILRV